jgi:hypothetical protein
LSRLNLGAANLYPCAAANPLTTRADLEQLLVDLTTPLLGHFSPGRAQIRLGVNRAHYGDPAGGLEGFARPLWGLAPFLAGGGQFAPLPLWLEGLAAGVDPAHPEYWGEPGDYDQRSVEQAALGFALLLCPDRIWSPLSVRSQDQLAAWLDRINRVRLVESNWLFFRKLVNAGLARVGRPSGESMDGHDDALLESFHLQDGWYADGAGKNEHRDGRVGDYYVPMAFQFYPLVLAGQAGPRDSGRAQLSRERARRFAQDFQHWFAADGSALPFGRSLTYRFAQGAFWGALAYAGVEALPWGVIKGLYLRHLRWWMRQPIFSESGLLSVGYAYPNQLVAESYNSPASPYWAFKAFLPLALPGSHPFWQAEEAPLPARRRIHTVPGAKLILQTSGAHDVVALNPGQPTLDWPRHAAHKYSKSAYSTRFGFTVPASTPTLTEGGFDSGIALSDDGRFFRVREQCLDAEVRDGVAYSIWRPWPGVELRAWIVAEARGHVRLYRLASDRKLWVVDSGFALTYTDKATRHAEPQSAQGALVRTPAGASLVRGLLGRLEPVCVDLGAGGHLLASLSAMPAVRATVEAGAMWLATWVQGSEHPDWNFRDLPAFTVAVHDEVAVVAREGAEWWTSADGGGGKSSVARLTELDETV